MTQNSPDRDTTIEDIHATRRRIAEKFGHDLAAIVQDAQQRQAASGHEIWTEAEAIGLSVSRRYGSKRARMNPALSV